MQGSVSAVTDPAADGPGTPPAAVGVLLAAGGGTRYAGATHKLLAPLGTTTVFERALQAALAAGFGELIVVTGAVALTLPDTVVECHNPNWAAGQATSVRRALDEAVGLGASAVVVGLGDQPFVTTQAWRQVAASAAAIAVATYAGRRGNPVRLDASIWHLLPATGDAGARSIMGVHPELVEEVPCEGSPADIDTLEDLERWT